MQSDGCRTSHIIILIRLNEEISKRKRLNVIYFYSSNNFFLHTIAKKVGFDGKVIRKKFAALFCSSQMISDRLLKNLDR